MQTIDTDAGKAALASVTQTLIYNFPSINALTSRILQLLDGPDAAGPSKTAVEIIEETIAKYGFSGKVVNASNRKDDGVVVILTGSTGYLGSQVLEGLLKDQRITKVYALNRPGRDGDSVAERHRKRFSEKGLDESLLKSAKLTFLETDSAAENLGLDDATYAEVCPVGFYCKFCTHGRFSCLRRSMSSSISPGGLTLISRWPPLNLTFVGRTI